MHLSPRPSVRRALVTAALALGGCDASAAVIDDGGAPPDAAPRGHEPLVAAAAEVGPEGGALEARAGEHHAYLSVPADALHTRTLIELELGETQGSTSVRLEPSELELERGAELRVAAEEGFAAWIVVDGEVQRLHHRAIPGALVVQLHDFSRTVFVGPDPAGWPQ